MNKYRRIYQTAVICTASFAGYLAGKNEKFWRKSVNLNNVFGLGEADNTVFSEALPGLPIFGTVSAATIQGSVSKYSAPEYVPEPSPNAPRTSQIMRYGFPSFSNVRSMSDYVLSYDTRGKIPYWVFEHLTADNVARNDSVDRSKCHFHEDFSVHEFFRSTNSDYKKSGFDRGHMAAAGNHRSQQQYVAETFLLSNMAPQVGRGFNRDKWNDLERYCRKLAKEYKNVYVCTGPLFLPRLENDGRYYVKYQVIGVNNVAVPTHFFKVVVCENGNGELELESFILPNTKIDDATPIDTFHVSTEIIERASGLLFFTQINRSKLKKINGRKIS